MKKSFAILIGTLCAAGTAASGTVKPGVGHDQDRNPAAAGTAIPGCKDGKVGIRGAESVFTRSARGEQPGCGDTTGTT